MRARFATVAALLAGVALGALGERSWQPNTISPAIATTKAPMPTPTDGSTSTTLIPIGDAQMIKSMKMMDTEMKGVHLNGEQDHDFMQLMIPHHEAAIEMAQVEIRYGIRPQLKATAMNIIKGQTLEIAQMRGWLCSWEADCEHH